MKVFNFFLLWIFGFFVLLAFDLFVEAFVFEWLNWNGTNKMIGFLLCGGELLQFGSLLVSKC